jgi:hypothetical protein
MLLVLPWLVTTTPTLRGKMLWWALPVTENHLKQTQSQQQKFNKHIQGTTAKTTDTGRNFKYTCWSTFWTLHTLTHCGPVFFPLYLS